MGDDIDPSEWRLACELAAVAVPEGIDDAMVERRLALGSDVSWSFAHTMLRESLERTARKKGRWKNHHRACVRALRHLYHGDDTSVSERVGLHLLAAGETADAVEPLLHASDQHQRFGDFDRGLVLCDRREAALTELEIDVTDPRWAEGWLMAARCTYKQAEFDASEEYLDKVEANLEATAPNAIRAEAWRIRAQVTRMRGDMRQALTLAERASSEFKALGDLQSAADCDVIMARLHLESTGDHKKGLDLATSAQRRLKDFDDHGGLAECAYIMGHLNLAIGDVAVAESSAIEARKLYELVGNRFGMAACANFRGEIARNQADFAAAEQHYLSAVAILESIGSKATFVPRLNLALVLVQREAFEEAEPVLLALEEEGRAGKHAVLCYAHYALMACYASSDRWDEWDEQYDLAKEYRPETGRVDQDLATMAQQAGDFADEAGHDERAQGAYKLALEHWKALDKPEKIDEVEGKLES
jgi:tetratricopeptide (TPR) repeat protein